MKKILLTAAIAFVAFGTFAQGYVNFANTSTSTVSNILTGQKIPLGTAFFAQLYYGAANSAEASLVAVATAPVNYNGPGRIGAGGRFTDPAIVAGGATGTFQIRSWEALLGGTWEDAVAHVTSGDPQYTGMVFGQSALLQVVTANGGVAPLPTPAALAGLQSFYLQPVPEPSVIALGALGLAALLYRRRK